MSTFGEVAGTSVTSEVRMARKGTATDDIDPLPTALPADQGGTEGGNNLTTKQTIRERSWEDASYYDSQEEYEAMVAEYVTRENIEKVHQLSTYVDAIIDTHGVSINDALGGVELVNGTARLRRRVIDGGTYELVTQADGSLEPEFVSRTTYSYFFHDSSLQYHREDGTVDEYCRTWRSGDSLVDFCRNEQVHQPAEEVKGRVESRFAEFAPGYVPEKPVSVFRRKLDFLLGARAA